MATNLIERIKEKGMTVLGVAQKMGLSTVYIYNWANKYNPSAKYIYKLAKILKCKPEELNHKK